MSSRKGADLGITTGAIQAVNYRAAWNNTFSYTVNDEVTRAYSLFVAVSAGTGNDPLNDLVEFSPVLKQQTTNTANPATSVTGTFGVATTAGNFLVAVVTQQVGNGNGTPTYTMPAGWVSCGAQIAGASNQVTQMFYYPNAASASTVAVTSSLNYALGISLMEFSGCPTSVAQLQLASAGNTTTTVTSTTVTAAAATTTPKTLLVSSFLEASNAAITSETGASFSAVNSYVIGATNTIDTRFATLPNGSVPTATANTATAQYTTLMLASFTFPSTQYWAKIANIGNQENVGQVATGGATQTLPNPESQSITRIVLTANLTITMPPIVVGQSLTVTLVQDATGGRTVTWDPLIKWPGGTAPTMTATAQKGDVYSFVADGSGNWIGFVAGQNY